MDNHNYPLVDLATLNASAKNGTNKAPIKLTPLCSEGFDKLKARLCSPLVLRHFYPALGTILESDMSDYVMSGILYQRHPYLAKAEGRGILHLVAFLLETMSPVECNYGFGDKELQAIIASME